MKQHIFLIACLFCLFISCGESTSSVPDNDPAVDNDTAPDVDSAVYECDPKTEQCFKAVATSGREADFSVTDPADNGEQVVSDHATNLMWQAEFDDQRNFNQSSDYCSLLTFAGLDDWRVPGVHELASIIDYGVPTPNIYSSLFKDTPGDYFWTSALFHGEPQDAWLVNFLDGGITHLNNGTRTYVRCVRDISPILSPAKRFVESGTEGEIIITDSVTGLSWTKTAKDSVSQSESKSYCDSLNYGGYKNWQLPSVNDLRSIIDYRLSTPASLAPFPGEWMWSYNEQTGVSLYGYHVSLGDGTVLPELKDELHHAVCVKKD